MGSVGDAYDNSVAEAFFSILQRELLDQHTWHDREQLARVVFEWIEARYNPKRIDLSQHEQTHLDDGAAQLNGRPRQTLGWMKPSEAFNQIIAMTA